MSLTESMFRYRISDISAFSISPASRYAMTQNLASKFRQAADTCRRAGAILPGQAESDFSAGHDNFPIVFSCLICFILKALKSILSKPRTMLP